MANLSQLGASR